MLSKKYHHGDLKNALIQVGIAILSKDGVGGLSLCKVAKQAGVSHSAIAAISTEGFNQLYAELDAAISSYARHRKRQLIEGRLAYVGFAMNNIDTFKIMFSGVLEKEKEYPTFVEISRKTFDRVVDVVRVCQTAGILRTGSPEVRAVSVWRQMHGIVSLALEGQISQTVLQSHSLPEIVSFAID